MKRIFVGRRTLIAAVLALALVLPWAWAPTAHARVDSSVDTVDAEAPGFDLWDWVLQLLGLESMSAAADDSGTVEPTDTSTPLPTLGPEGFGVGTTTSDSGEEGAGLDPEG